MKVPINSKRVRVHDNTITLGMFSERSEQTFPKYFIQIRRTMPNISLGYQAISYGRLNDNLSCNNKALIFNTDDDYIAACCRAQR